MIILNYYNDFLNSALSNKFIYSLNYGSLTSYKKYKKWKVAGKFGDRT